MLIEICLFSAVVEFVTTCTISEPYHETLRLVHPYKAKIRSCDVMQHVSGVTYVEITNFLHGYVINMKNMHPKGQCRGECSSYGNTKTGKCYRNKWCQKQPHCPNIVKCDFISTQLHVCLADMGKTDRRYEFVKNTNQEQFCRKGKSTFLETQMRGLFDICDYCFCICEESESPFSDIFISLDLALANISDNRVVTGVRFVKRNRTIHFQIQDGKLLPHGQINRTTLRWVPIQENQNYHKLSWKHRSLHLNSIFTNPNFLVTGIGFRRFDSNMRLHLQIQMTRFDFESGRLINSSYLKSQPGAYFINKFGKEEVKLVKPGIPTRGSVWNRVHTSDKYVRFTHTDYEKDAAQTTVPFFDAQPIGVGEALSGVGIFHKGEVGSGGFIAPTLYTYDFR